MKILSSIRFNSSLLSKDYQIDYLQLYTSLPTILKPFRILSFKYDLKLQRVFELPYNTEAFKTYDMVILSDDIINTKSKAHRIIKDIENYVSPHCKLVFFWVNIVHHLDYLELSDRWIIGTFDKNDAVRYGLRYYGFFYLYEIYEPIMSVNNNGVDVFFAGLDKGRFSHLESIETKLNKEQIITNFVYVDPIKAIVNRKYSKFIPYDEMIGHILNSRCIIDYYQDYQSGFTQRLYEAIFYQKKLITNNPYISSLSFYNNNNILLIQNDDISEVKEFLSQSFIPYKECIKEEYKARTWLNRVINDKECQDVKLLNE